jgi:hypothetical protein
MWDFITKLPLSRDLITNIKYDSIWVTMDHVTKYAIILPFQEDYIVEDLVTLFNQHVLMDHGILAKIILDQDKLFTSKF